MRGVILEFLCTIIKLGPAYKLPFDVDSESEKRQSSEVDKASGTVRRRASKLYSQWSLEYHFAYNPCNLESAPSLYFNCVKAFGRGSDSVLSMQSSSSQWSRCSNS